MVKEASKNNESKANKERQPKTNNPFAFRACLCSRAALMFVFVPVFVFVLVFVFFFHAHTHTESTACCTLLAYLVSVRCIRFLSVCLAVAIKAATC